MSLSVVYGREFDGTVTTFGTTGYTFKNTFVLYDRSTSSVWYPLSSGRFDAIGGQLRGRTIPFLAQPEKTTLKEWLTKYPDSDVLLMDDPHGG